MFSFIYLVNHLARALGRGKGGRSFRPRASVALPGGASIGVPPAFFSFSLFSIFTPGAHFTPRESDFSESFFFFSSALSVLLRPACSCLLGGRRRPGRPFIVLPGRLTCYVFRRGWAWIPVLISKDASNVPDSFSFWSRFFSLQRQGMQKDQYMQRKSSGQRVVDMDMDIYSTPL